MNGSLMRLASLENSAKFGRSVFSFSSWVNRFYFLESFFTLQGVKVDSLQVAAPLGTGILSKVFFFKRCKRTGL